MKKKIKFRINLGLAALWMLVVALPANAAAASRDTVDLQWMPASGKTGVVDPGVATSTLVRNDQGVAMTIHTVQLPPNTANTVGGSSSIIPLPAATGPLPSAAGFTTCLCRP